jgi:hypothetical protein
MKHDYHGQISGSMTVSSDEMDDVGDGGREDCVKNSGMPTSACRVPSGSQDGSCAAPAGQ